MTLREIDAVLFDLPDGDGYAPRERIFTGAVAQFELPSELSDDLRAVCRAAFPNACVLFPDVTRTLAALSRSRLEGIDHQWFCPHARPEAGMPGSRGCVSTQS
jgi:hypothetical protein